MTRTVQGIYRDGGIELLETPNGVSEGRVTVTLIQPDSKKPEPRRLIRGKYRNGTLSTEDDFESARWRDEREIDGD